MRINHKSDLHDDHIKTIKKNIFPISKQQKLYIHGHTPKPFCTCPMGSGSSAIGHVLSEVIYLQLGSLFHLVLKKYFW